jgi:predicted RNase H-like nuclease (RuvC/YqgF family)
MTSPLVPKDGDTAETVRMRFIQQQLSDIGSDLKEFSATIKDLSCKFESLESTYVRGHVTLESTVNEIQHDLALHEKANEKSIGVLESTVLSLKDEVRDLKDAIDELMILKRAVYAMTAIIVAGVVSILIGLLTHVIHIP